MDGNTLPEAWQTSQHRLTNGSPPTHRMNALGSKHRGPLLRIPTNLHFVGIGGVGMSAVASVWHDLNGRSSGSDLNASALVRRLQDQGIPVGIGHDAAHLAPLLVDGRPAHAGLVVSTAVPHDNPELVEARRLGMPVFHRSEILAALMTGHRSVAVSGTHGKTTTTGMLGTLLLEAGADPTLLIGGDMPGIGGNARTGQGPWLVAEADESDKSMQRLTADWVIITNLEGDHLEHYRDLDDILDTMAIWISRLPAHAVIIACIDDAGVRSLLPRIDRTVVTYGCSPEADHRIDQEHLTAQGSTFALNGRNWTVGVPGHHNVLNASGAIVTAMEMGFAPETLGNGLGRFNGVGRRFQDRGTVAGVQVLEDYAHHPSEIKATLAAAKLLNRPIWVVFQPHRYSRTSALFEGFARAFDEASGVAFLDIYGAGEAPTSVSSSQLAEAVRAGNPALKVCYWPDPAGAAHQAESIVQPGDLLILMGAGNVNRLAEPLLEALEAREQTTRPRSA